MLLLHSYKKSLVCCFLNCWKSQQGFPQSKNRLQLLSQSKHLTCASPLWSGSWAEKALSVIVKHEAHYDASSSYPTRVCFWSGCDQTLDYASTVYEEQNLFATGNDDTLVWTSPETWLLTHLDKGTPSTQQPSVASFSVKTFSVTLFGHCKVCVLFSTWFCVLLVFCNIDFLIY